MLYYFINAIIGAIVATLVAYIGKTNLYMLAGLIPLFPTFTLFAQISAYQIGGEQQLKEVVIFGLISMVPYLIYMGSFHFSLTQDIKVLYASLISIFVWGISALFIFYLAKKFISV